MLGVFPRVLIRRGEGMGVRGTAAGPRRPGQSSNRWLHTLFRHDRAVPDKTEGAKHLTQVGQRYCEDEVLAS
jgi:hypothetical protein